MYISYTATPEFPHQVCALTTYTIRLRGGKSLVNFPLSLALSRMALGVWLLPCQCFPPLQALRAFHLAEAQGQPLLSSPSPFFPSSLLTHTHTHRNTDFHFSYSVRLAAPPPQGWLKTGGQTSSSVGGMHAGEMLPEDLFEAAADCVDEYSKHRCVFVSDEPRCEVSVCCQLDGPTYTSIYTLCTYINILR